MNGGKKGLGSGWFPTREFGLEFFGVFCGFGQVTLLLQRLNEF
jgi:hypothetical protein